MTILTAVRTLIDLLDDSPKQDVGLVDESIGDFDLGAHHRVCGVFGGVHGVILQVLLVLPAKLDLAAKQQVVEVRLTLTHLSCAGFTPFKQRSAFNYW